MRFLASLFAGLLLVVLAIASACQATPITPISTTTTEMPAKDAGMAEAGLPPLESQPPPLIPAAQRQDANSSPVLYDALRGRVWTANGDVGSVSEVDIDTPRVLAEIPVGQDIRSVALSPDSKWLAAVDRNGASVTLLDPDTRTVVRAIPLGTHPRAAVWDAWDPRWLFVALEDDDGVAVIDRTAGVYVKTIPTGRIPSGLTVSRLRHEMYVTYRIDGMVTRVSLDSQAVVNDVALADQPSDPNPQTPQGKPFAFESGAMSADGNLLWLPHELLSPLHPFQFQELVFPTVSVVDFSTGGAEVVTDPNDPNGVIAGRKLLCVGDVSEAFAGGISNPIEMGPSSALCAIAVPDPTGAIEVMSQFCAAAMHPNGNTGYVLACGSEDLLTFDLTAGIAVDMLRNPPSATQPSGWGDHPIGLALDALGQRAFVVSDQSHTLTRLDTAGGDLTQHVTVLGSPIPLAAKDPVDAETRAGLTLFYRANSAKGTLATTGNNWLSCGACHLDGFVSTNMRLFESAYVVDATKDAQIGHVGLADLFSTAPTPTSTSFDPHDILVAFTDMAGLAPDRSGQVRTGAIDPSTPTPDAATMAAEVARVVARDLPVGPNWLVPGAAPNESYDGAWCGNCHQAEYAAWQESAHAHSAKDPMVAFGMGVEQGLRGNQYSRLCAGCHDPVSVRLGDTSLASGRGITCLGCHDVSRLIQAGGNGDLQAAAQDWTVDHKAQASAELVRLRTPEFCGGCHEQFVPGTGLLAIATLSEWKAGPYAASNPPTTCVGCHMPSTPNADGGVVADHRVVGGNVYLAASLGETSMVDALKGNLASAVHLTATPSGSGFAITITNGGSGHGFPTGVTDIREPWVELQALDADKNVLATYGGPDATGLIPSAAARFGIDIASADGTVLYNHQLSQATRIPFDRHVGPQAALQVVVTPSSPAPSGMAELDAVLYYRNVRTTYYRAATGDASASAPDVEVARIKVQ